MKAKNVILGVITLLLVMIIAMVTILVNPDVKAHILGTKINQTNIIKNGKFSVKMEEDKETHVIRLSCKIAYQSKYKREINKCIKLYSEDINAIAGSYFRQFKFTDINKEEFFEEAKDNLQKSINNFFNEKIQGEGKEPIEYIGDIVLYDVIYQ